MYASIAVISTVLSLGIAWLYLSLHQRRGRRGKISLAMTVAAGLHTLLVLVTLAQRRPANLFTRLGVPTNAPVDRIRSLLMEEAGFRERGTVAVPPAIPKDIDLLLTRLGVQGSRDIYVRFGQRAMQTCLYCSSTADYAILLLSSILLDYLRTATLLLLLTTKVDGRQRWRTSVLGMLTCAFLAEVYAFIFISAVPLEKNARTAFMWHDNLFLARNLLFLALPVFIQIMPAIYPPPPASAMLVPALRKLEHTLPRSHLLKYFRQAVLRHPYSRQRAVEFWTVEANEGARARSNPAVQATASKLGLGFAPLTGSGDQSGPASVLRANARMAVQSLKPLFMPPPN